MKHAVWIAENTYLSTGDSCRSLLACSPHAAFSDTARCCVVTNDTGDLCACRALLNVFFLRT